MDPVVFFHCADHCVLLHETAVMFLAAFLITTAFLLYTELFSHGKHSPKHDFCHHKFSCRLPDVSPQSVFQSGLCRQRCRAHRLMDNAFMTLLQYRHTSQAPALKEINIF